MAWLRTLTDSGIVQMTDTRDTITLLGKGGTPPTGTLFTAQGATQTYHFGRVPNGSSYGLTTRDEAGNVLFDALTYGRMARPVGVMRGNIQFSDTDVQVQLYPAGRTYAVWVVNTVSFARIRPGSGLIGGVMNYWYYMDPQDLEIEIDGGEVVITATRELSPDPQGSTSVGIYEGGGKYDWTAVVLDVTHY